MLKSISRIKALTIHASDGEIGSVKDFYFDDETWTIRYLVVNTGNWLSGRLVLISPLWLQELNWETMELKIALTKKQIQNSPDIDTHKPISRQHEAEYLDHFTSQYYWSGSKAWGPGQIVSESDPSDSHLRSANAVKGYHIGASDGEMGHVEDFMISTDTWGIRYLEVDWNWMPGKQVLISPEWIDHISWHESTVRVALGSNTIKNAPEFIESREITRGYEEQLHKYYGRRPYWIRDAMLEDEPEVLVATFLV